ncbi:FtsW/RodA/SpoVE family cell cycle protein [Arenivirga flava]|uniref:FtsW/RodA/SpoVE family cell cycle protein n=1 Tax=Arenivirga flava TaxID=1930060 RepID=UPI0024E07C06|nr:FtsW/RodA/SpoVE family cell cycle protein [Arenivirga flava]
MSTATGLQNLTGVITLKLRTPSRLRNLELGLLLFAIAINAGSFVLVQFGVLGQVEPGMLTASFALAGLALAVHVALRISAPDADPLILPIATVLNGTGLAMIYRLDLAKGFEGWGAASVRQIVWTTLAILIATAVLVALRNYRVLQRFTYVAMFSAIVLLLLPLVPGLARTDDVAAKVWIDVAGFSFQPGEIAKIALGVFFAGYLVQHRDSLAVGGRKLLGMRLPRVRDLGPILLIWAAAMGVLVFQRDLGTSLLYFGLFLVMIYVATGRLSWVLLGLGLFLGGAIIASQTLVYVNSRFTVWLDAFNPQYADGDAYQLVQGIFGIAQGGMVGTGLGQGRPSIVPLAESDFIIASLGEELGLAGLFALLALYLLLVSRGFRIGFAGRDDFGRLLAVGLSFVVALQVFIVIGGVTRVIPLTGLTTPFLAAGGSSLIANWIIAAILLRLSDSVRNQPRLVVGP